MTHSVGNQNRNEFILDRSEALRRDAQIVAMWPPLLPSRRRGVVRGTHRFFNQ